MHLVQKAISEIPHVRTSVLRHTSCLYFYKICINTRHCDCKIGTMMMMMNDDNDISIKLSLEVGHHDFSVEFLTREISYRLDLTTMEADSGR